jgi:uncharacterized linocin/CFP29 family protein
MHRLVQDFTRRGMAEERRAESLREALEWFAPFVVQGEATRARIAATFLPVVGPLPAATNIVAPKKISNGTGLSIDESTMLHLTTLEVTLHMKRPYVTDPIAWDALIRRAANVIARLEDAMVFEGLPFTPPAGLPGIYRVTGGQKCDGLLKAGNKHPVVLNLRAARPGEILISGVSQAIRQLKRRGQYGPFAIVLGQDLYLIAQTPDLRSFDLPQDRIIPFLGGGPLLRCSLLEGGSGVVIALGGAPAEIVVAPDMSVEFLHIDADETFVLRVFEKIALRIKEYGAIVSLQAGESLARVRGKSASPRRGKRR